MAGFWRWVGFGVGWCSRGVHWCSRGEWEVVGLLAFEAGFHLAGRAGEFLFDDGGEHIGCVVPAVGAELAIVREQVGGQVGPAILPIGGHNDSAQHCGGV